jgi:hypothetical protein
VLAGAVYRAGARSLSFRVLLYQGFDELDSTKNIFIPLETRYLHTPIVKNIDLYSLTDQSERDKDGVRPVPRHSEMNVSGL